MKHSNFLILVTAAMHIGMIAQPSFARQSELETANYIPPEGYVPNAEVALAIAKAVATPIYTKRILDSEKPLKARLENGVWIVTGTVPEREKGGALECGISKQTGQIVRMIHFK